MTPYATMRSSQLKVGSALNEPSSTLHRSTCADHALGPRDLRVVSACPAIVTFVVTRMQIYADGALVERRRPTSPYVMRRIAPPPEHRSVSASTTSRTPSWPSGRRPRRHRNGL